MTHSFPRDIQSLDRVFDFLDSCIVSHSLGDSIGFTLKFAVEEVFTNMVKYNAEAKEDISITVELNDGSLVTRLVDHEVVPFDPTKQEEVDVTLPLEQRRPGGLGIHLVKNMVDGIKYEHENGVSTITLTLRTDR